ncbi:MAG: hypothetical protein ACK5KR_02485 [Breznakia sp.]
MLDEVGRAQKNSLSSNYSKEKTLKLVEKLKEKFASNKFIVGTEDICDIEENAFFKNCGAGYNFIKIDPYGGVFECILSTNKIGELSVDYGLHKYLQDNHSKILNYTSIIAPSKSICRSCEKLSHCYSCIVKARQSHCDLFNN